MFHRMTDYNLLYITPLQFKEDVNYDQIHTRYIWYKICVSVFLKLSDP